VQTVEDEIAFGMENQGFSPAMMRERIAMVCEMLNITHLRQRTVFTLSGGEAQRVAIAAALALEPPHLILDEPTSQLDPPAAHALLDSLAELNRTLGLTIILAEHRLERVLGYATHMLHLERNAVHFGAPQAILPVSPLRPPVVEIGLHLGWQPLPLTVDEARSTQHIMPFPVPARPSATPPREAAIQITGLRAGYGATAILQDLDWTVYRGEIVGLLGMNGAGKSTLIKALIGLVKPQAGEVLLLGQSVAELTRTRRKSRNKQQAEPISRVVGYVPQNPNSVLFADTLRDELRFTLHNHALPGDGLDFLAELGLTGFADRYPRDLSGGERQRAALAAMLTAQPPIMLLDEPTRGLDYQQKQRLSRLIRNWANDGRTVVVATHDMEWIAGLATRTTILRAGQIIADGAPGDVMLHSPGFTTQLGELFGDPGCLTVESFLTSL